MAGSCTDLPTFHAIITLQAGKCDRHALTWHFELVTFSTAIRTPVPFTPITETCRSAQLRMAWLKPACMRALQAHLRGTRGAIQSNVLDVLLDHNPLPLPCLPVRQTLTIIHDCHVLLACWHRSKTRGSHVCLSTRGALSTHGMLTRYRLGPQMGIIKIESRCTLN